MMNPDVEEFDQRNAVPQLETSCTELKVRASQRPGCMLLARCDRASYRWRTMQQHICKFLPEISPACVAVSRFEFKHRTLRHPGKCRSSHLKSTSPMRCGRLGQHPASSRLEYQLPNRFVKFASSSPSFWRQSLFAPHQYIFEHISFAHHIGIRLRALLGPH